MCTYKCKSHYTLRLEIMAKRQVSLFHGKLTPLSSFHKQRAVMSFDDEAMDMAYKCLESTESFCDLGSKKFSLFGNSSLKPEQFSTHEKLYRRAIVADCILFEAILVFLKQGLTSYVKGGYLLRKAYKMYHKIFQETEQLCQHPSPISRPGTMSPTDRHVGSSLYDKEAAKCAVSNDLDEEKVPDDIDLQQVGEDLSSLHIGLSGFGGANGKSEGE